jgi:cytochrome c peroxidase
LGIVLVQFAFIGLQTPASSDTISSSYDLSVNSLKQQWQNLLNRLSSREQICGTDKDALKAEIHSLRLALKKNDFWLRYTDPLLYRNLNAPLAIEWETEVFEKHEQPYRREGKGLYLAEQLLDDSCVSGSEIYALLEPGIAALGGFAADSIKKIVALPSSFYFANRLHLLNLASIYTTGFECPDTTRILPELLEMTGNLQEFYFLYNKENPQTALPAEYLNRYSRMVLFVKEQNNNRSGFDHYHFIREFVNPLFRNNQHLIKKYGLQSQLLTDYSLREDAETIFDKKLFIAQSGAGLYNTISDTALLREIRETGKLLFFDPILSGNARRSCASCHQPAHFFSDPVNKVPRAFDSLHTLERNTPTLYNALHNHLLMTDGRHFRTEDQLLSVIANPEEMNCPDKTLMKNIRKNPFYRKKFQQFNKNLPGNPSLGPRHVTSALLTFLETLGFYKAPFDEAMNDQKDISPEAIKGFNLFMGKAQCGTCHFIPAFNGVKPPFNGSEFEVVGVPADTFFTALSEDPGRFRVHPVPEMKNAFRTPPLRNIAETAPYMHNGVFETLEEVVLFYNHGGGKGKGLAVPNQTLAEDSLQLNPMEEKELLAFHQTLTENAPTLPTPKKLPRSKNKPYRNRIPGGVY